MSDYGTEMEYAPNATVAVIAKFAGSPTKEERAGKAASDYAIHLHKLQAALENNSVRKYTESPPIPGGLRAYSSLFYSP